MKPVTALLFVFSVVGQANLIQVDLVSTSLSGAPGDTLHYFATLTNTSLTQTVTFAGTSTTAVDVHLTIDTTPFLLNGPLSLAPGQVYSTFGIWDVLLDPSTAVGPYVGNSVSLYGTVDDGVTSTFADVADTAFDVNVVAASNVPEPATLMLVAGGLGALAILSKSRRRRSNGRS